MIAEPHRHVETETLRDLLDETLSSEQADWVEHHLSGCKRCRSELELMAGEQPWWDETVSVLSPTSSTEVELRSAEKRTDAPADAACNPLDPSLQWIRPLLEESSASELGRIDHYPIDGVIGQGGMGVVLRGTDRELNRPVAIKILAPHLAGVGAARARFMREAQAAAAIVHPSIVPIYSIATKARLPYIVMPYIAGGNLQQRIDRDGPLELAELLRIGLQVAEGLQAAHRQGVIHRDIKPANILIEEGNGRVLISDFGLARALDDATLTVSGMIAGTPQYMSPEQARGEPVDPRSDLFSLGSLLYALAIGRPPFRGDSPLAVLRKISDTRPRPIVEINEQMPAWLDRLIGRLMTVDKSQRIASAAETVVLLREALAYVRSPAGRSLPKSLSSDRVPRRYAIIASSLAAVVAAGGLLLALQPQWFGNDPRTESTGKKGAGVFAPPRGSSSESADAARLPSQSPGQSLNETPFRWHDGSMEIDLLEINRQLDGLSRLVEDWEPANRPGPPSPFENSLEKDSQ